MGDTFTVVVIGVAAVLGGAAFGLAWGLRQGPGEQKTNHLSVGGLESMRRLRLKLLFVGITGLGLMVASALSAQAQTNYLIKDKPRTIKSRSDQQSQVWRIQIWGRGSRTGCFISGRSVMDTFRGPGDAVDYLDSVFLENLDTGASIVGGPDHEEVPPPFDIQTRDIFMRGGSNDVFHVRGTARVWWSTDGALGPTGLHEIPRHAVACVRVPFAADTEATIFMPVIDGVEPDDADPQELEGQEERGPR
jgi:hypothetical protein